MQEQLKRIKNKKLSDLDQRLFGNMDKVETINSTIENLEQFQQFLLTQIGKFQEQAKQKNKNHQIKQVIQQNCMTLRQSIMKVVPDIQSSRTKFRQQISSPINNFRSTRNQKFSFNNQRQEIKYDQSIHRQTILIAQKLKKTEQKLQNNQKHTQNIEKQLFFTKKELSSLKITSKQEIQKVKFNLNAQSKQKIKTLTQENKNHKEKSQYLTLKVQKLQKQVKQLEEQIKFLRKKQNQKESFDYLPISNRKSLQNIKNLNGSEIRSKLESQLQKKLPNNKTFLKQSKILEISQQNPKYDSKVKDSKPEYQSFMQKMKFDFTQKLNKFAQSQIQNERSQIQNQQEPETSTFRQCSTLNLEEFSSNPNSRYAFRSIQLDRNNQEQSQISIPKLLKKNPSFSSFKTQKIDQNQLRYHSFSQKDSGIRSHCQSSQKYQTNGPNKKETSSFQSGSKKQNHDIMRKTKSNMFKKQGGDTSQKQNIISSLTPSVYESNIARMKGLVQNKAQQIRTGDKRRHNQSKQKLKIFSML